MSVPTISGELVLSDSVAEFCEKYPNVKVEMHLENRFVDLVNERIDLAIRTGMMSDSSLIARPLIDSHWVILASPLSGKTPRAAESGRFTDTQLPHLHLSAKRYLKLADAPPGYR